MKAALLALVLLLAAPPALASGPLAVKAAPAFAAPVPMEALVEQALSQAPALRAASTQVAAQRAQSEAARSTYWPQVSVNGSLAQTTSVSPAQTVAQPFSLSNTGINVRQTLFTFGKLDASIQQAEAQEAVAVHQAALAAVDVAFGVRQAYLNWAQAAGLERYVGEQLRYAEATLAEARARFKAGVAAQLEVTRAETTIAQARASLAGAKATTAQARRTLAAAIGQTTPVAGEPQFPAVPAMANRPLSALESAAEAHPSLHIGRSQLALSQAAAQAAERAGLPDLNADGSYGLRARDFQGVPNWQAGLSVNWPIFTGFAITNQARSARELAASARASLEARRLTVLRDVDNAHLALAGERERVPAAKAAVDAARANLTQAQGRYRAGVGSIIEVADAQSLLATAQSEWVRAVTAHHLAIAELQRALGLTGASNER